MHKTKFVMVVHFTAFTAVPVHKQPFFGELSLVVIHMRATTGTVVFDVIAPATLHLF